MNRRRVFVLALALAFCLAIGIRAAKTHLDLLDYDAVKALDHQFTAERLDKESNTMDLSGTARMEHRADEAHPYPSFTVTVDSGEPLTVDENGFREICPCCGYAIAGILVRPRRFWPGFIPFPTANAMRSH